MFLINYLILYEEKTRLSNIDSISKLDNEGLDVYGQFKITFNSVEEGFIDSDVPYEGELLIEWFTRLNQALINLYRDNFVTFAEPDSGIIWYEFELKDNVEIRQIQSSGQMGFESIMGSEPRDKRDLVWCETISREELYCTIITSTENFIREILLLNKLLGNTYELKELIEKKNIVKGLFPAFTNEL